MLSQSCFYKVQPTFQRRINVVSTLWIDVDPTLKMNQNPTSDFQRCTTLIQGQCPTLKQRWNNVTQCRNNVTQSRNNVSQHWYNIDTTLFHPSVDMSENFIESSRASDDYGFANTWIVFILLNEKTFFTIY